MGFLDDRRARRAERDRQRHAAEEQAKAAIRQAAYDRALVAWNREGDELQELLEDCKSFSGATGNETPNLSVQLKKAELVFGIFVGAALIEPRKTASHWEGRNQGVSVRVPGTKSMRYRVGATRGTFVQGEELPTPIDQGTVTLTNQRIVFQGSKQAREWAFAKLIGVEHHDDQPWTSIAVSNRQKVSGFLYDDAHANDIRFRIALALAHFNDTVGDLTHDIEGQLAAHLGNRPTAPTAALTTASAEPAAPRPTEDT